MSFDGSGGRPPAGIDAAGRPLPFGLTERQHKFCVAYLANGGNQKEAAIQAGYRGSQISMTASRLMQNRKVVSFLKDKATDAASEGKCLSKEETLARLTHEALKAQADNSRVQALSLLARYHGLLTDRLEVEEKRASSPAGMLATLRAVLTALVPPELLPIALENARKQFGIEDEELDEPTQH
jgi:hypothetical protein